MPFSNKYFVKSCLKRPPLADCTNSQVIGNALVKKSIRRVHFQLPEEEPVLNFKKRMNSSNYSDYKGELVQNNLAELGDITKAAYFTLIKSFGPTRAKETIFWVNYQPGITSNYLKYMMEWDWMSELLDEEQKALHQCFKQCIWKEVEPNDDLTDEACLYIVRLRSMMAMTNLVRKYRMSINSVFLLLLDIRLLHSIAGESDLEAIVNNFVPLGISRHDLESSTESDVIRKTGGIPVLVENFQPKSTTLPKELEIWIRDNSYAKLFGRLFVLFNAAQPIPRTWHYNCVPMYQLAIACGFILQQLPTSDTYNIDVLYILCLPSMIEKRYLRLNPQFELKTKEQGWQLMEKAVAQNMIIFARNMLEQEMGARFRYLKNSFIAHVPHRIINKSVGPKVTSNAPDIHFPLWPKEINTNDWDPFLDQVPLDTVIQPRDVSHSPDVYVKCLLRPALNNQPAQYALLCIQTKHGAQDLCITKVLDEVAKCPQGYGYRDLQFDNVFHEQLKDGEMIRVEYKITFVYAAMNHTKVQNALTKEQWYQDETEECIRCTHELFPSLPEHIELIVLKKPGLIEMLGPSMYWYLKEQRPNDHSENNIQSLYQDPTQRHPSADSTNAEVVQRDIQAFCSQFEHFNVQIVLKPHPMTSTPRHSFDQPSFRTPPVFLTPDTQLQRNLLLSVGDISAFAVDEYSDPSETKELNMQEDANMEKVGHSQGFNNENNNNQKKVREAKQKIANQLPGKTLKGNSKTPRSTIPVAPTTQPVASHKATSAHPKSLPHVDKDMKSFTSKTIAIVSHSKANNNNMSINSKLQVALQNWQSHQVCKQAHLKEIKQLVGIDCRVDLQPKLEDFILEIIQNGGGHIERFGEVLVGFKNSYLAQYVKMLQRQRVSCGKQEICSARRITFTLTTDVKLPIEVQEDHAVIYIKPNEFWSRRCKEF